MFASTPATGPVDALAEATARPSGSLTVRYLVISDIHGNLEALDTVLAALTPLGYDKVLVLGDLVGYGADPNAVVDRVRALDPFKIIRGNHDKVAAGLDDGESFNSSREARCCGPTTR